MATNRMMKVGTGVALYKKMEGTSASMLDRQMGQLPELRSTYTAASARQRERQERQGAAAGA